MQRSRARRASAGLTLLLTTVLALGGPAAAFADDSTPVSDMRELRDRHEREREETRRRIDAEERALELEHEEQRAELRRHREEALAVLATDVEQRRRARDEAREARLAEIAAQAEEDARRTVDEAGARRAELARVVSEVVAVAGDADDEGAWLPVLLERYDARRRERVHRAERDRSNAHAAIERDLDTKLRALRADAVARRDATEQRRREFDAEHAREVRDVEASIASRRAALLERVRGRPDVDEVARYGREAEKALHDELEDRLDGLVDALDTRLRALDRSLESDLEALRSDEERARRDAAERRDAADEVRDRAVETADDELDAVEAAVKAALKDEDGIEEVLDERTDDWMRDALEHVADRAKERRREALRHWGELEKSSAVREEQTRRRIERDYERAERDLETRRKRAEHELKRRQDRELRLLRSRHYLASTRLSSYLERTGGLTPMADWYDPESDPGSPWNTARRIGLDRLPPQLTGAGVDVAMVDTGVVDVPGLAESEIIVGPDFSFEDAVPHLRARDTNGHGTHLASLVVSRDADWARGDRTRSPQRFLGVAPDARLISVKAGTATGATDVSQVIAAINWVIANKDTDGRNIRVLVLAYGTDSRQDPRVDPLAYAVERAWHAGITVVVAAGNDGWDTPRLALPAADPYVIAVGASAPEDAKRTVVTDYTNQGADGRGLDFLAPGQSLVGLRNPGSFSDASNARGRAGERFVRGSGTSQAAAVTGGAVALLLQARPHLRPDEVKAVLTASSQRTGGASVGNLRIDRAVKARIPRDAMQHWPRSDGSGSLAASRGSFHVEIEGRELTGDVDVFGADWSGSSWRRDSWTGNQWSGNQWSGNSWRNDLWSGDSWAGSSWRGARWTGNQWSGNQWSGNQWSASSWRKQAWVKNSWRGSTWREHAWLAAGRR